MPRKTIVRGLVTGVVVSDNERYLGEGFMEAFGNSLTLYVQTANDWVVTTLGKEAADVRALCGKYFKSEADADITKVMNVLRRTQRGMRGAQEIKIQALAGGISGQVSGGFWGGKRRIHLSMSYIAERKNKDIEHLGTMTYLHEATHLYAETDDHGDQGYLEHRADAFVNAQDPYRRTGLTSAQALVNADSYAGFVFAAANPDY
jgi:hypothetical protein